MPIFYGHVRSNGQLTEDRLGHPYDNAEEACAEAVKAMPKLLERSLQPDNTYVTTEVRDEEGTVCVVRGSVVLERR
jgi:hypothetical protein